VPSRNSTPGSPRAAALGLLGRRDYTAAELAERLARRGFPREDIDATLSTLVAAGIVNDRRTAEGHVRQASRLKGRGAWRIGRELQARGIAEDIARQALASLSPEDEREAIRRFLTRRPRAESPADRRRLFQQLVRRGFAPALIADELRTGMDEDV
jgi:regulatory protein